MERFWSKVAIAGDDECWVWISPATGSGGYGKFKLDGKAVDTHRAAWILTHGEIPSGLWVLHKCDNPPCCNPQHLFLGTNSDNMKDCARKGRLPNNLGDAVGCRSPRRFSPDEIREIRAMYKRGVFGYQSIANIYGTTLRRIECIIKRLTYKDIPA